MTEIERGQSYIRIFIGAGYDWEKCIPVDGDRTPDGVRIGSIEVGPRPDGSWFLRDGESEKYYRAAGAA